jgi:hypothetical protein
VTPPQAPATETYDEDPFAQPTPSNKAPRDANAVKDKSAALPHDSARASAK